MTKIAVRYDVPVWIYMDTADPTVVEKCVVNDAHSFGAVVEAEVMDDDYCAIRPANQMEVIVADGVAKNGNTEYPAWEFGW